MTNSARLRRDVAAFKRRGGIVQEVPMGASADNHGPRRRVLPERRKK